MTYLQRTDIYLDSNLSPLQHSQLFPVFTFSDFDDDTCLINQINGSIGKSIKQKRMRQGNELDLKKQKSEGKKQNSNDGV